MPKKKSVIPFLVLYPLVIYLGVLLSSHYDPNAASVIAWIPKVMEQPFYLVYTDKTLMFVLGLSLVYAVGVMYYMTLEDNTRRGAEHGSAKWGNVKQLAAILRAKKPKDNLIFTQNAKLGLDAKKHRLNLNVLVVGGSGAGKTRFFVKPNLMQNNCSYVITDPKTGATRS